MSTVITNLREQRFFYDKKIEYKLWADIISVLKLYIQNM